MMSFVRKLRRTWEVNGPAYLLGAAPSAVEQKVLDPAKYALYNPYGVVDEAELFSAAPEESVWSYGSPVEFTVSPPLNEESPAALRDRVGTYEMGPSRVRELPLVQIRGEFALPRTRDGKFVLEEMGTEPMLRDRVVRTYDAMGLRERATEILRPSRSGFESPTYDTIVNMVPRHRSTAESPNYGHWLLEDLPRLRAVDRYREQTGREPRILVQSRPPSWMLDTLRLLGFSSDDWIEWDDTTATVSRYLVPTLPYIHTRGTRHSPADRKWVSEQMKSRIDLGDPDEYPRRLFVSRQGQPRRAIANFEEVRELLQGLGFEVIRPERLAIEDQIRHFHHAEVLVGVHSAGMNNNLFSTDASMLEIFPSGSLPTTNFVVASERGLEYSFLHGGPVPGEAARSLKNSNIVVDTTELRRNVQRLVAEP